MQVENEPNFDCRQLNYDPRWFLVHDKDDGNKLFAMKQDLNGDLLECVMTTDRRTGDDFGHCAGYYNHANRYDTKEAFRKKVKIGCRYDNDCNDFLPVCGDNKTCQPLPKCVGDDNNFCCDMKNPNIANGWWFPRSWSELSRLDLGSCKYNDRMRKYEAPDRTYVTTEVGGGWQGFMWHALDPFNPIANSRIRGCFVVNNQNVPDDFKDKCNLKL